MKRMNGIKRTIVRRPSLGTVVGSLALMVALGGSAAANLPGKNSVVSTDIKNGHVKAADIRTNAVRSDELATNAVDSDELATDAVDTDELARGAVRASELGPIAERSRTVSVLDGSQNNATVDCQPGEIVIGGGNNWSQLNTNVRLQRSMRDGNGWNAAGSNNSGATRNLTVYAYCLAV